MNVLITGATSGIGKQLALDHHISGDMVWGVGRDASRLEALTEKGITPVQLDLTNLIETRSVLSELPEMDRIILCAGNCEYIDPERFDAELFRRVWTINLGGTVNCIDALWNKMPDGCQLVLVGSLAHLLPFSRAGAYGGSKAALYYLFNTLRTDLVSRPISLHLVQPGFVKTPLTDKNEFNMPSLISTEAASQYIRTGLAKKKTVINFPAGFSMMLHLLHVLPSSVQVRICQYLARQEKAA